MENGQLNVELTTDGVVMQTLIRHTWEQAHDDCDQWESARSLTTITRFLSFQDSFDPTKVEREIAIMKRQLAENRLVVLDWTIYTSMNMKGHVKVEFTCDDQYRPLGATVQRGTPIR
jgi:hypothetical protein